MRKFDVMLSIRTNKGDRTKIQRLARKLRMSKSAAIRYAVSMALTVGNVSVRAGK
jgi:uncharacterized protein YraI